MATRQDSPTKKTGKVAGKTAKRAPRAATIPEELKLLRRSIDNLDSALICLLAERFQITEKVGHLKAVHSLPAVDPKREAAQFVRIRGLATKCGLDPNVAEQVLKFILKDVVRRHRAIAER